MPTDNNPADYGEATAWLSELGRWLGRRGWYARLTVHADGPPKLRVVHPDDSSMTLDVIVEWRADGWWFRIHRGPLIGFADQLQATTIAVMDALNPEPYSNSPDHRPPSEGAWPS